MHFFYNITKKRKWKYLHFESWIFIQSRFRPIKHLKMTVWTSVLWNIVMKLPKKWPEMVVKQPFIILFRFRTVYTRYRIKAQKCQQMAPYLAWRNLSPRISSQQIKFTVRYVWHLTKGVSSTMFFTSNAEIYI